MLKGGSTYYLLYDQIGTFKAVADTSGNIVKQIDYDSFGNIISDTNPAFTVPFGFVGGLHDRDTGLVRFGYRDYDPTIGRWTANDPIDFAGGDPNLYGYALNNPVNLIDPWGLLSYLVSRQLKGVSSASHNFIITNAKFIGDPNATVYSFGMNEKGMVGRVNEKTTGFSAGTHLSDIAAWNALKDHKDPCEDLSPSDAPDFIVDAYANSLIENQDYAAAAGPFGANSNSAAQAIANVSSQSYVPTPGGNRSSHGAGSWREIRFNMSVLAPAP